jgi:serine/threonine protein kinase
MVQRRAATRLLSRATSGSIPLVSWFGARSTPTDLEPEEGSLVESKELGTMQVGRRIGQGGMGRVYEAWRPNLPQATFAVKFLSPNLLQDSAALERFATEARRLSELRHRNIVRVHGYGLTEYGPCIMMELLKGKPLSKLVKGVSGGVLDRGLACSIIVEVLEGLQRVHENGLVHRDIKGDNIFLETSDGDVVVKLIDFGIVRQTDNLDQTNAFIGTPATAAPEQLMAQPIGAWTDIYQVGVLAYILLGREHPFRTAQADGLQALMKAQMYEAPPPLAQLAPDLPAEIILAVMIMLRKESRERVWVGRDGRPDGSAKAFRVPFRNLLREMEDRELAHEGLHATTHHRMLELLNGSFETWGPVPTPALPAAGVAPPDPLAPGAADPPVGQKAGAPLGGSRSGIHSQFSGTSTATALPGLAQLPEPPAQGGSTATFDGSWLMGGAGLAPQTGAAAAVASSTTGPAAHTTEPSARKRTGMMMLLLSLGTALTLGFPLLGWLVFRHPVSYGGAAVAHASATAVSPPPPIYPTPMPADSGSAIENVPPPAPPFLASASAPEPAAKSDASRAPANRAPSAARPTPAASQKSSTAPIRPRATGPAPSVANGQPWGLGLFNN